MDFTVDPMDVSFGDILSARFQELIADNGFTHSRTSWKDTKLDGSALGETLREGSGMFAFWSYHTNDDDWTYLGVDKKANIAFLAYYQNNSRGVVHVAGLVADEVELWASKYMDGLPEVFHEKNTDQIDIRFWLTANGGPSSTMRTLDAYHWQDIKRNYPDDVRGKVTELMDTDVPEAGGKLVLWHGPPGVGKTSAIQALGDAWTDWADAEYVVDPERFFGDAAYMLSVLTFKKQRQQANEDSEKWRLIIVEDAGMFIRKDAEKTTGQAFSRLLNVTDGLIGQGMKIIILITTNEPLDQIHDALSRPGRCMANIKFRNFKRPEALAWLGVDQAGIVDEASLAELFEKQATVKTLVETEDAPVSRVGYI